MRLRQIALVAEDLAAARADLTALLGVHGAYVDPGVGKYGLENIVVPVGDTFLEVVSPKEPGTTAGRLLEKRGGDGGYMVILQVPDFAAARARAEAAGVRIVSERHGDNFDFAHFHPRDIGGAIVSIDEMRPPEHWEWGGPNWKDAVDTSVVTAISGAEIQSADPAAMAARWAEVLGLRVRVGDDRIELPLDGGVIGFTLATDGRGDGLAALHLAVTDPAAFRAGAASLGMAGPDGAITVCGTRIVPVSTESLP